MYSNALMWDSKTWWYNRAVLLTIVMIAVLVLVPCVMVIADGLGGYLSEKVVGRDGVGNSQLVIGRDGVSNSTLDIVMGPVVSTLAPSNILMDAGGTTATLWGNLSNLNGFPSATVFFEWGYDTSYGNIVGTQTVAAIGTYAGTLAHFQPDVVVHYRFAGDSGDGINYGSDQTLIVGGSSSFNLMNLLPFLFVVLLIFLLVGLIKSNLPAILIVLFGGIIVYMGISLLQGIVRALQVLW